MIDKKDRAVRDSIYKGETPKLWKRHDMKNSEGDLYLSRWVLLRIFGYEMVLHKFTLPDFESCMHDHPWNFASLMLRGGYIEDYKGPNGVTITRHHKPVGIVFNKATHTHTVQELPNGTAWTVIFRSPKIREWGFETKKGWMPWKNFLGATVENIVLWCSTPEETK